MPQHLLNLLLLLALLAKSTQGTAALIQVSTSASWL